MKKKLIYLDQFYLSHMASAQDGRWAHLPRLAVYKELYSLARQAVQKNVAVFPRSQTHIDETDLAEYTAEALTEVSHTLSWGIQFHLPKTVRVNQLMRYAHAFVGEIAVSEARWQEAFDADPHAPASAQSTSFLGGEILLAAAHSVSASARATQVKRRDFIGTMFEAQRARQVRAGVTFKQAMTLEAWTRISQHYLLSGFAFDYLREAESRHSLGLKVAPKLVAHLDSAASAHAEGLLDAALHEGISGIDLFSFLTSLAALRVPCIDIDARLTAMLLTDKERKVEASDMDDVEAVSIAAPYCDVITCDVRIADLVRRRNGKTSLLDDYPHVQVFTGTAKGVEALRDCLATLVG